MGGFPHGDGDGSVFNLIDRDMLLGRSPRCTRNDFCHFSAAAHNGNATVFYHDRDVSALFANVEFGFHNNTSCVSHMLLSAMQEAAPRFSKFYHKLQRAAT
jgi:hypothetical protein